MTYEEIVATMNTDSVVQKLLQAPIPARVAYIGLDNQPRVIPISYLWDRQHIVFASPPTWYKVVDFETRYPGPA